MTDLLELPFDQYQRYRLTADLVDEVRPANTVWSILDVGGRTALLRAFLPRDRVTLVDLEPSSQPGLVLGDGARLPFASGSFDVVAAFDTLEHVPPSLRDAFVDECRRVSKRYVAIVGPYQHPAVEEAELLVQRFLKDKLGVEHRYLEEHRHHGLPDRARVESRLSASGATVQSFGHGNVERWLAMICLSLYMDYTDELRIVAARFFRFYNQLLYPSDHAEPVYRHIVMAAIGGAPLPTGSGALAPPVMPPGAVARITELAFELALFERAHEWVHAEREEFRKVVAELKKDLEGHRQSLANAVADGQRREEGRIAAVAERDQARKQSEGLRTELEAERKGRQREVLDVQEVLRANDAKIAELHAALLGRWKNLRRALGPRGPMP